MPTKYDTKDWRNLPIERWNATTYHAFLADKIAEKYGVTYVPGGGGSKSARWMREKGMIKTTQGKYGNAVVRRFIELCVEDYRPNAQFLAPTFAFMMAHMDRNWQVAQADIAAEAKRRKRQEERESTEMTAEELDDWL